MSFSVKRIEMKLPYRMGTVNAYLVETATGFVLIDTGSAKNRGDVEWSLEDSECRPKDLSLIILTHGDFDHIGNARHLRKLYGAKIAMHEADWPMAQDGKMFASRAKRPPLFVGKAAGKIFGFDKKRRFKPNHALKDGQQLTAWGFNAKVIELPGHSGGSIGILTADKEFFCGDLLSNVDGTPQMHSIMDDTGIAEKTIEMLAHLEIGTVYPGHGEAFEFSELDLAE